MKPLANDIKNVLKKVFNKQNPQLAEILLNWGKIVGPRFSSYSYPTKLSIIREKGEPINILYIAVTNSSLSVEISFQQDLILERIAIYFGFKSIDKLKFKLEY